MSEEVSVCPFCGGNNAEFICDYKYDEYSDCNRYNPKMSCGCGCSLEAYEGFTLWHHDDFWGKDEKLEQMIKDNTEKSKAELLKVWNTRPIETQLRADLEACKQALAQSESRAEDLAGQVERLTDQTKGE